MQDYHKEGLEKLWRSPWKIFERNPEKIIAILEEIHGRFSEGFLEEISEEIFREISESIFVKISNSKKNPQKIL